MTIMEIFCKYFVHFRNVTQRDAEIKGIGICDSQNIVSFFAQSLVKEVCVKLIFRVSIEVSQMLRLDTVWVSSIQEHLQAAVFEQAAHRPSAVQSQSRQEALSNETIGFGSKVHSLYIRYMKVYGHICIYLTIFKVRGYEGYVPRVYIWEYS